MPEACPPTDEAHVKSERARQHDEASFAAGASSRIIETVRRVLVTLGIAAAIAAAPSASAKVIVKGYPLAHSCPRAGVRDEVDPWLMNSCNCTSYVAWALAVNDQRTDWFVPGSMDAWNWPNAARQAGLPVGTAPQIRSVAVWPRLSKPWGHIAYVTAVHRDGTFDVSEYNLGPNFGFPRFTYDARRDVDADGAVFIYVPRR
jgi:peptidoglycan DL-endopeptidase CwlO